MCYQPQPHWIAHPPHMPPGLQAAAASTASQATPPAGGFGTCDPRYPCIAPPAGGPAFTIVGAPLAVTPGNANEVKLAAAKRRAPDRGWCCPRYDLCGPYGSWLCSIPLWCFWLLVLGITTFGIVVVATNHGFSGGLDGTITRINILSLPDRDFTGNVDLQFEFVVKNMGQNNLGFDSISGEVEYRSFHLGDHEAGGLDVQPKSTVKHILRFASRDLSDPGWLTRGYILANLLSDYSSDMPLPLDINIQVEGGYIKLHNLGLRLTFSASMRCHLGISLTKYNELMQCKARGCTDLQDAWSDALQQGTKTQMDQGRRLCSRAMLYGDFPALVGTCIAVYALSLCFVFCIPAYRFSHRPPSGMLAPRVLDKE